jgi:hypothetical protein
MTTSGKPLKSHFKMANGKFAPGHVGGPGRPPGSRNKATLAVQELLDGQAEAITQKAVDLALEGDIAALKLCLERICPPRKERAVDVALPALESTEDAARSVAAILAAVTSGALTPNEGVALTGIVETHRRSLEAADFERRLEQLEIRTQVR